MEFDNIECDELPSPKNHLRRPHEFSAEPVPAMSGLDLFDCPVCYYPMHPPINQCRNGHPLCSKCKTRVENCPICRVDLSDIRCLALEYVAVAETYTRPCKYDSVGCPEKFPYYRLLQHQKACNFRPYNCPYAGSECSVTNNIPFLVTHLRDFHKVNMRTECAFNHCYVKSNPREVENATWMLTVFHCFGQHFCLHFEAFQLGMAPVYMAFLRFMGDETDAHNYSYSLEVGANGRKLIWEGTPRSIRDSHRKVRESRDGLIIPRNLALFFSGGDRKELKLIVTGRIWKEPPNPESVSENGHTLCSIIKTRVHNCCPTCRQELGDIRCLALETVAEWQELPCSYYSSGCPKSIPYYRWLENFRPYNCQYAGSECFVIDDIPFLVTHLRNDTRCTFSHRYVKSNPCEVENATWMLTVFHCFGQYFCLHFEAFQLGMAPVYMAFLRFMGDETDAHNYSYSLEVGANGRKLIWEGTPRSIHDSPRKVRDSCDGLIILRNMALFFSGGDRKELKLRVNGRIWK